MVIRPSRRCRVDAVVALHGGYGDLTLDQSVKPRTFSDGVLDVSVIEDMGDAASASRRCSA